MISFDSYSTVIDVDAAASAFPDRVENPAAVADIWREQKLTYATMSTLTGAYKDFWAMVEYPETAIRDVRVVSKEKRMLK